MPNFRNLGASGAEVNVFDKTPKGTSLPNFTRFKPLIVQIRSRVFFLGKPTKNGTLQKVTERLYFIYFRGIPHPTQFIKNGKCVGVTDVTNHTKFFNDR